MFYELTYIINPNIAEEELSKIKNQIADFIAKNNGQIQNQRPEIKKRLAYPLQKNNYGFYISVEFNIEPEKLTDLDKILKTNNNILRYLIIKRRAEKEVSAPAKLKKKPKEKVKIEELDKKLEELLK